MSLQEENHILFLTYLVTSLIPGIPHPVLIIHGEQGSSKSTFFKIIKSLIDPSAVEITSSPDNLREFIQVASHHWIYFLDNLSYLPDWISDALCRACTGEGFSKRELYTDDEDVVYSFCHCLGANGINLVASKPDLLDRSIIFGLEAIPPVKRKSEEKLWEGFGREKPAILGGLFDILSRGMAIYPSIRLAYTPRMADFAIWGCAIAKALGYSEKAFLDAYNENIRQQNQEALGASPVAQAIIAFMADKPIWEGASHELFDKLNGWAETFRINTKARTWPKDPRWLWRRIKEVRPNLMAMGIEADRWEVGTSSIVLLRNNKENVATNAIDATGQEGQGLSSGNTSGNKKNGATVMPLPRPASDKDDGNSGNNGNIFPSLSGGDEILLLEKGEI